MAKRFEGSIRVDRRSVGKLIGGGGSNLKKVSKSVGHGTYIVAFNEEDATRSGHNLGDYVRKQGRVSNADSFYISANSVEAVRNAADQLRNPKRPSEVVSVSPEAIGTIIGKGGVGIKNIKKIAGDNCYIVHKHEEGGFVVTADTRSGVLRGVQKIQDAEKSYFQSQREFHKKRYQKVTENSSESSNRSNRYEGLECSSGEEEEATEGNLKATEGNLKPTLGFKVTGAIASRKNENRKRWGIRQQLFESEIDKLEGMGRFEDAEKLSIHDISWNEVSAYEEKTKESRSARRIQLSVEKKFPSLNEFEKLSDSVIVEKDIGSWSNGVSDEVRSSEGKKEEESTKLPISFVGFKPYTGSWADAADSESDSDDDE